MRTFACLASGVRALLSLLKLMIPFQLFHLSFSLAQEEHHRHLHKATVPTPSPAPCPSPRDGRWFPRISPPSGHRVSFPIMWSPCPFPIIWLPCLFPTRNLFSLYHTLEGQNKTKRLRCFKRLDPVEALHQTDRTKQQRSVQSMFFFQ